MHERQVMQIAEFKKSFEHIDSEFNAVRGVLTAKATIKDINDIKGEMHVLATKEDHIRTRDAL